jgi:hypothetical protein
MAPERYDIQRKIDRRVHSLFLRTPRGTPNHVRRARNVPDGASLNLREETAEIANQIGAFEVCGQTLECSNSLAFRTGTLLCDELFADLACNLLVGGHAAPAAPSQEDSLLPQPRSDQRNDPASTIRSSQRHRDLWPPAGTGRQFEPMISITTDYPPANFQIVRNLRSHTC